MDKRLHFKRPIKWDGKDNEMTEIRAAEFIIDRSGAVIKDHRGVLKVPRQATQEEIESCETIT